jgi:FlaA1/EpsC-like NDP-sugar epimerase
MPAFIAAGFSAAEKSFFIDDLAADWFPCSSGEPDSAFVRRRHEGKSILVTGAGGWIGSGLAKAIRQAAPSQVVLLDHSEHDLSQIYRELVEQTPANGAEVVPVLGDVCDERLLQALFRRYQPALTYHLAAVKHVPLAESNPFAAIRNNAIGTYRLAHAAREHGPTELIMVSTDKAASPRSLMGASKRVAELVLLCLTGIGTEMKAVRFGNVFGSRGSVVPLFVRQISQGGPVTITHPDVHRYFLSLRQAINLILGVEGTAYDEHIFVPAFGNQIRILELAECLIRRAGHIPGTDIQIHFTGLQPGEKLSEDLLSSGEVASTGRTNGLHRVHSPHVAATDLHHAIAGLEKCVEEFDLAAMLEVLRGIIPEYEPSEALLASATAQCCRPEAI